MGNPASSWELFLPLSWLIYLPALGLWCCTQAFSSCTIRDYSSLQGGVGNLPGARMEPVCPALAGGFLTTGPRGKSWRFRTGKGCLPSLPALMASPCQRHFALPRAKLCVWGHPGRATTEQNFSQKKEGLRPAGGIPEHPSPLPVVSQLLGQPGGIESISGRGHLWTHSPSWTSLEMFTTLRTPLRWIEVFEPICTC